MPTLRVIAGLGCLVAAFFLALFAWVAFVWGEVWFKFIPVIFTLGLIAVGLFLILKRHSALSKKAKVLIATFTGLLVLAPAILVIHIRHGRKLLQIRATEFLKRPVPSAVKGDSEGVVGFHYVGPNEDGLKLSHGLIERYAANGRIRWSAAIQGQFAMSAMEIGSCEDADAVKTNEEARLHVADCRAILDDEWRMGFWQWVEDTIELKRTIPEHEEEDAHFKNLKPADSTNAAPLQR